MWQVPCAAAVLSQILLATPAYSEDVYNLYQRQTGFSLPGVTLPQGQDEVRAADGTTCRSAVSGSGAYLDVGVIQGAARDTGETAAYGRVVIPLERPRKRVDCTRLYELEVERLQMEIRLLKMGLADGGGATRTQKAGWAEEGWTNAGQ